MILTACLTGILSLSAGLALAFSSGPPDARTNAPGEGNCTACHTSFTLNSGSGSLSVSGINGSYEAGQIYDLVISLDDQGASRWGFEFTVIDDNGFAIGTVASQNNNAQISSTATRDYAKQTLAGTQIGTTGGVSWTVRWTAPSSGAGNATIYLAGNAADGSFSSSGDRIYAISETWAEGTLTPAPVPAIAAAVLRPNYPNPFNPRTTVAYELAETQWVRLSIYSIDGRLVKILTDGVRSEGKHESLWNGLNERGLAVPSGTYFYRLQAAGSDQTRAMALVR